jgi:hypothetical protein
MVNNLSAHTMSPRRNSFQSRLGSRRHQGVVLPGGKLLWFGVTKVLLVAALLLFISSALQGGSAERVAAEIRNLEASHGELVNANILLRANKARLFSSEAVGVLAGNQLAIHIPASGQYRKLRSL